MVNIMRIVLGKSFPFLLLAFLPVSVLAVPPEVANLQFTDENTMTWDFVDGTRGYHVYHTTYARAAAGDYGDCHLGNHRSTTLTGFDDFGPGEVHLFLVTAFDEAGEGSAGTIPGPLTVERSLTTPCTPSRRNFGFQVNGDPGDGVPDGVEAARNPSMMTYSSSRDVSGVFLHSGEFLLIAEDLNWWDRSPTDPSSSQALREFLKLQAEDPGTKPETLNSIYGASGHNGKGWQGTSTQGPGYQGPGYFGQILPLPAMLEGVWESYSGGGILGGSSGVSDEELMVFGVSATAEWGGSAGAVDVTDLFGSATHALFPGNFHPNFDYQISNPHFYTPPDSGGGTSMGRGKRINFGTLTLTAVGMSRADSRVDPGGKSFGTLNMGQPAVQIQVLGFNCPTYAQCDKYRQNQQCDLYNKCFDAYLECFNPSSELILGPDGKPIFKLYVDPVPPIRLPCDPPLSEETIDYSSPRFSTVRDGRTYRSQVSYNGPLGHGWDHAANSRLAPSGGDVIVHDGSGRADLFVRTGPTTFDSPPGLYSTLIQELGGPFTMRDPDGTLHNYHAFDGSNREGTIESVEDRHGNVTSYLYDHQGLLTTVVDTMGRSIEYGYDPLGRVISIADFAGREVQYGYDTNGDLVTVRSPVVTGTPNGNDFPAGKVTTYVYASGFADERLNHNLTAIIRPQEEAIALPAVQVDYGTTVGETDFDRVTVQTIGGDDPVAGPVGGALTYSYESLNPGAPPDTDTPRREATVTDRNGNETEFVHNAAGNLLSHKAFTNRDLRPGEPPTIRAPGRAAATATAAPWFPGSGRSATSRSTTGGCRRPIRAATTRSTSRRTAACSRRLATRVPSSTITRRGIRRPTASRRWPRGSGSIPAASPSGSVIRTATGSPIRPAATRS
jgi:YD repeat-containing protein